MIGKQDFRDRTSSQNRPPEVEAYDASDMHLQRIWRNWNKGGYQKYIEESAKLKENTRELVEFIKGLELIDPDDALTLHELGCGSGRNIMYLKQAFPRIRFSGNDLDEQCCTLFMDKSRRFYLKFYEADTYRFLKSDVENKQQVDILLASDHLMHLSRQIIREVYELMAKYAKAHIILREPCGNLVVLKGGLEAEPILWAADVFDEKFPGFVLNASATCQRANAIKQYTLMHFIKNGSD